MGDFVLERMYIVEKNMKARLGHYADVIERMSVAANKLKLEVSVGCSMNASENFLAEMAAKGIQISPVLKSSVLGRGERIVAKVFGVEKYKKAKKSMFPGLGFYLPETLNADRFFYPSAELADVVGWVKKPRGSAVIFAFWCSPTVEHPRAMEVIAKTLSRRPTSEIVLAAYDDFTFADLLPLRDHCQIIRLPCPYDPGDANSTSHSDDAFTVGMFGWMRAERGSDLKHEIKSELSSLGVKSVDMSTGAPKTARQTGKATGYVDDLASMMKNCAAVIWPSNSRPYAERTSGIVFNCLANGIPVVMPSNCRPYNIVKLYQHPHECFDRHATPDIIAATQRLLSNYTANKVAASLSSAKFMGAEGTIACMKMVDVTLKRTVKH
jgi:hypothetical protein